MYLSRESFSRFNTLMTVDRAISKATPICQAKSRFERRSRSI